MLKGNKVLRFKKAFPYKKEKNTKIFPYKKEKTYICKKIFMELKKYFQINNSLTPSCKNCKIITFNQSRLIEHNGLKIEVMPAFIRISGFQG